MNERGALLLAGTAHLALLAALSLSWAMTAKTIPVIEEMTPVEVVDVSDVPAVTEEPKPSIDAAPQETVEAEAPKPEPDATPAPPQPAPEPPKTVSEVPPPEAKPEAKPVPKVEKPKAETKPKSVFELAKPAPRRLDAEQLSTLLDKSLPRAPQKPRDVSRFADSIEKSIPKGVKLDARAAASLQQAIYAQLSPCWSPPLGGNEDVAKAAVVLDVEFNPDGSVKGRPAVAEIKGIPSGHEGYGRAFRDAAMRTVLNPRCTPLKLPPEMYNADNGWKHIQLAISASTMT